jgi:hypothetical protein
MDKKLIYKSLLGILVLVLVFYFTNPIYVREGWRKDFLKLDAQKMMDPLNENMDSSDVFYFAESSNFSFHEKDTIKKTISEFVNDCYPGIKITKIEKGGMHAGVYRALISNIRENAKVKVVIVTMNLRSFGSDWRNAVGENVNQELQIAYAHYPELLRKMRLVFKAYNYKEEWERREVFMSDISTTTLKSPSPLPSGVTTTNEWDIYVSQNFFKDTNSVRDMSKINLACHNVKNFGFNIDTLTNDRIKDFDKIVLLCNKKKIKLFFNLLAENVEYADSLVGKPLADIMKENRDILVKYYAHKGITVIDNLELVKGEDYIDQDWTTEHYNQRGRMTIAKNVAKVLQNVFPSENECK